MRLHLLDEKIFHEYENMMFKYHFYGIVILVLTLVFDASKDSYTLEILHLKHFVTCLVFVSYD